MKLYTYTGNPTGRKVEVVLKHLGLDYEVREMSFGNGDMRSDWFKKINPNGLIPALEDGERKIWESNAIITYLCTVKSPGHELFKANLQPEITQWLFWEAAQYNAALRLVIFETIIKSIFDLGEGNAGVIKKGQEDFARWAAVLDKHLEGRNFVVGDDWTLADYAIGYLEALIDKIPVDLTPFPNVQGFYERLTANPNWAATAPPQEQVT